MNVAGLSLGSLAWSIQYQGNNSNRHFSSSRIPPAVLLPLHPGEPLRFDTWNPPHPRGIGHDWPPESRVGDGFGSGRFPLAAAWTGRRIPEGSNQWKWRSSVDEELCSPIDAISYSSARLAKVYSPDLPVGIVVPNDFRQSEQQKTLDLCREEGIEASLIWLPIAASLSWLADHHDFLPDCSDESAIPLVALVVHADWGHINLTRLQLVPWPTQEPKRWVPARRNPTVADTIPGFGWAEEAQATSNSRIKLRWQSLFGKSNEHIQLTPSLRPRPGQGNLLQEMQNWKVPQQDLSRCLLKVREWIQENCSRIDIMIVIGDWAGAFGELSRHVTSSIHNSFVQVEGYKAEEYLARGAAIFKSAQERKEICYLDSLPDLKLFIEKQGQFIWHPLLKTGYVEGGMESKSPETTDVAVRSGEKHVKLVVWHEEYEGIRELTAQLHQPASAMIPGKLRVSATPAQGNAILQIDLAASGDRPAQTILANWKRMSVILDNHGRPQNRERYLEQQPRSYPELSPRLSSANRWNIVSLKIRSLLSSQRLLDMGPNSLKRILQELVDVKESLLKKDPNATQRIAGREIRVDATAVGSDGKVSNNQQLLDEFTTLLHLLWRQHRDQPGNDIGTLLRTISYTSLENVEFENWLIKKLSHRVVNDRSAIDNACAHCLRDSANIRSFVVRVFGLDGLGGRLNVDGLKAVSQVLRYRAEATKEITDDESYDIIERCLRTFRGEMEIRQGRGYAFRWTSLIIVYLLRRRIYNSEFLEPDSDLAKSAKGLFMEAIERSKKGKLRPFGGTVDTKAAIQQMIDYIDRKGSGHIVLADE